MKEKRCLYCDEEIDGLRIRHGELDYCTDGCSDKYRLEGGKKKPIQLYEISNDRKLVSSPKILEKLCAMAELIKD